MSEKWRLSGRSAVFPKEVNGVGWEFTERPGGWWVAVSPAGVRWRFQFVQRRQSLDAHVGGRNFHGELIPQQRGIAAHEQAGSDLVAQFPGKVRKILVREGQRVEAAEPMLLVEAMKMEFAVRAPFSGKVTKVLVQEGQQLTPGERFLDFEAAPGEE